MEGKYTLTGTKYDMMFTESNPSTVIVKLKCTEILKRNSKETLLT